MTESIPGATTPARLPTGLDSSTVNNKMLNKSQLQFRVLYLPWSCSVAGFHCNFIENKVQNLGNERWQICKEPHVDSGQCIFYMQDTCIPRNELPKFIALCIETLRMGTNMVAGNQHNSLSMSCAMQALIHLLWNS